MSSGASTDRYTPPGRRYPFSTQVGVLSGGDRAPRLPLAVVAGAAEALVQATGMFEGRWAVLTVFLVLKPDFTATLQPSVGRALGTAVGSGAAALVALAAPGPVGLSAAAVLAIATAYALFDAGYLLYTAFLTLYIVILLDILGLPADSTAAARLAQTALGSAIALLGYWLWHCAAAGWASPETRARVTLL
ncbi:FUSC family protein [Streptomyces broussonetiae]|uniref:Integral membrane bound transporter domain-containing protein n=1 Tax=Streptomyces broussonetiae TaxID=2686304 RepID=A0A6I6MPU0_9ACTN|nr:FUSC family protein [Streptomyces broussonetiae]QHA02468.1 hypothetical protein GQF42_03430 [Streptomyces broussonetiae]